MLYSIVISYKEDDFVIQSEAATPDDAIARGIGSGEGDRIRLFDSRQIEDLRREIASAEDHGRCVAIDGLTNVWCTGFLVRDELAQFHVIATARQSEAHNPCFQPPGSARG